MKSMKVNLESSAWDNEVIAKMRKTRILDSLIALVMLIGLMFAPFVFAFVFAGDTLIVIANAIYFTFIVFWLMFWLMASLNALSPVSDTRTLDTVLSVITQHSVLARHAAQITAMDRSITNMEARAYVDYADNHAKQTGVINDNATYVDPKGKSGLRGSRHNDGHISSDSTAPVPHGRTEYPCGDNSSSCGGGHDGGSSGSSCGGGSDGGGC